MHAHIAQWPTDRQRRLLFIRSNRVERSVPELRRYGIHQADVSRVLPLAFLAPDIVEAILDGRQSVELTVARLKRVRLPHAWADQRRLQGFTH